LEVVVVTVRVFVAWVDVYFNVAWEAVSEGGLAYGEVEHLTEEVLGWSFFDLLLDGGEYFCVKFFGRGFHRGCATSFISITLPRRVTVSLHWLQRRDSPMQLAAMRSGTSSSVYSSKVQLLALDWNWTGAPQLHFTTRLSNIDIVTPSLKFIHDYGNYHEFLRRGRRYAEFL